MITRETVEKLRADRVTLLRQVDELAERADGAAAGASANQLRERLRAYTGLVEAVLDAMSVDQPAKDR